MAKARKASPKATKSKMDRAIKEENMARDIAGIPRLPKKKTAPKEIKRFNSPIDEGDKARFLHHLPKIEEARETISRATNALRTLYKTAKADGFVKADFDYAIGVSTPDKELATKEAIRRRLLICKFMGSDLGSQLDMFEEPSRVPAVDRAYEEGQTASMQDRGPKPSYDASTEQYAKYMEGYYAHQDILAKGIKATKKTAEKETAVKTADKYTGPRVVSNGGFGMSEEEFAKEQAAAAGALAEHGFSDEDAAL